MRRAVAAALLIVTLAALALATTRLRLDPDVDALLPAQGDAAVLARYVRAFGGGGLGVVLVQADTEADATAAADDVAARLGEAGSVEEVTARVELGGALTLRAAYRGADAAGRARITEALTDEAIDARVAETKRLLLAPGSGAAAELVLADPLRLGALALETRGVRAGIDPRADGRLATPDGRTQVVAVAPRGQALRGADARAFVKDVEGAMAGTAAAHPAASLSHTGPHAVSAQMEAMLRSDLERSSVISTVLASLVFVLLFRRARALVAILPPLALGTLWTAGLAALYPDGLSGVAAAFASVVVGVGFDTGVHVYAALLDARREGLAGADAARAARRRTTRPVLVAAAIAGAAFACLGASSIGAVAQLGLLCAAGEVTTALAIVAVTPEIGAWLERGPAPPGHGRGLAWLGALTSTRRRAALAIAVVGAFGLSWLVTGVPVGDALVGVRPSSLPALDAEARVLEAFGGARSPYTVLVEGSSLEEVAARADALAEQLAVSPEEVERVDALTALAPAVATQERRLAELEALDLPGRARVAREALARHGFAVARFEPYLEALARGTEEAVPVARAVEGAARVLAGRYVARAEDGAVLVAMQVHPVGRGDEARARLEALVARVDPAARVTGYARLESDLRGALARELPRIGALAAGIAAALLAASLRRAHEVGIALASLALGLGALVGAMAVFGVPLHVYSALVIPVLVGISVDEAMFLLHRAREGGDDGVRAALVHEGPLVVTTALTSGAGFLALVTCRYDGLRHLGWVGALGNGVQLAVALVLVPAALRLWRPR